MNNITDKLKVKSFLKENKTRKFYKMQHRRKGTYNVHLPTYLPK